MTARRVAYLDCFSGVSGDMLLGALLDAGVSLDGLRGELARLRLEGYSLDARKVERRGLAALQALVTVSEPQPPRTLADVVGIIEGAALPEVDKDRGTAVFRRLAEAEAAVHGETVETAHLHDVGAVDAIVDVMGSIAGLRLLGVDGLYCSALPAPTGRVGGPHGDMPLPAPATMDLLARAGAPLRGASDEGGELVTPTGAAVVSTLARFQRPEMLLRRMGYGAGARDLPGRPNVLRLWLGEAVEPPAHQMVLLETNIDDMSGEMLGYALEKLQAAGASDAWLAQVQMKKNRPGVVLSVICPPEREEALAQLILRETSTLGVRVRPVRRWEAERETFEFESSLGPAAVKVKRLPEEPPRVAPEYEACKRLAEETGLPLAEVYRIVQAEGERLVSSSDSQT